MYAAVFALVSCPELRYFANTSGMVPSYVKCTLRGAYAFVHCFVVVMAPMLPIAHVCGVFHMYMYVHVSRVANNSNLCPVGCLSPEQISVECIPYVTRSVVIGGENFVHTIAWGVPVV